MKVWGQDEDGKITWDEAERFYLIEEDRWRSEQKALRRSRLILRAIWWFIMLGPFLIVPALIWRG